MTKRQKQKWRQNFDKHERNRENPEESEEPLEKKSEGEELPTEEAKEESQGACGTSADEKPDGKRVGRWARRQMETKMSRFQGRKEAPANNQGASQNKNRPNPRARVITGNSQPATSNAQGNSFNKHRQTHKDRRQGASFERERGFEKPPLGRDRNKTSDGRNQVQGEGRLYSVHPSSKKNKYPCTFTEKSATFDISSLKEKDTIEVVRKLIEGMGYFKFLLRSDEEQHNSEEFIYDLTCVLAVACRGALNESTNKILAALKGSIFLKTKLPHFLDRVQESVILNCKDSKEWFFECLIQVFRTYLTRLPSSFADLPYDQLKRAVGYSGFSQEDEAKKKLDAFKQARDDIIRSERQKTGKRYTSRAGQKPPNDFREIPICPTNKEITAQERPFLRKNITKGQYENAEHYLDVQFRLLREDFLEPLREGIPEIIQNIRRQDRKHQMRNYRRVQIVDKKFTWSGVVYQVQIDVTGFDTKRWPHSKRLIYGSFLCLSQDNFKTMLFATVTEREPENLKRGKIEIRFIEGQDVVGIERRYCSYQMVESPAYFEAYRHVLEGLKQLDETIMPFKKYLVDCSEEVDPPEYLRRDDSQPPVFYDLSKALNVSEAANATAVPVLQAGAWPPVEALPLNKSQLEALRTAITTEFSIIQGPPGTGKTYVGAKIVRCLLENRFEWDPMQTSPMLMVCYTNHALDQFLEKVLEFLDHRSIIRVGGRSKSKKLEDCNLKKFTHRFRLYDKRDEVKERMEENDMQRKQRNEYLAKGEKELLMFSDLEELMSLAHVDQICKAKFPSNVANESRTPANTFTLWLCNDKLVSSCNRSTQEGAKDKTGKSLDARYGNEHHKMPSYVAIETSSSDVEETYGNSMSEVTTYNPFSGVNGVNSTSFERNEGFLELQNGMSFPPRNSPNIQSPLKEASDSLDQDIKSDSAILKVHEPMGVTDHTRTNEEVLTEKELNNVKEESIAVDREADLIMYQRRIQGEEDLLMAISERKGELVDNEQAQSLTNGEDDVGLVPVNNEKQYNPFFWNETEENQAAGRKGDEEANRNARKKKRKRKKGEKRIKRITGDITTLKEKLKNIEMMTAAEVMSVDNIWNLSEEGRLGLYLFWIENYRERYRVEIHRSEQEYKQLCEELEVITFEEEEQVIRQATVVGMTTTTASRYHSVLQRVAPKIVIIEEAAEVMEAHIITSLSHETKHVILIGDHKQLRPKATVYELARTYNLEVSLFERMVMNNMDCKRLSIQHRMRPEIAALTKRIYDHEIIDDGSVCNFENISGICKNLFFIQHCKAEHHVDGLQSYANQHEARFLVALCEYLLRQGINKTQITVLTMYTGQLLLLQEHMPRQAFEGVKVCAVDNFQGEENDIILLSLVRSNSEGRIGFLGESNRICVALSRARKGFYCIGNFSLLQSQCKLWKEICVDLEKEKAIGDKLNLICKRHKNITAVTEAREFNPLGGCNMPCGERLPCGHACDKQCHAFEHKEGECQKRCLIRCSNDHPCNRICHYPQECRKCEHKMTKIVPKCSHEQQMSCYVDPETFLCKKKCEKMLPCTHNCREECGQKCTSRCMVTFMKSLSCGHKKPLPCYMDPVDYKQCNEACPKLLDCGHKCSRRCRETCQCNTEINIELPCKHTKLVLCPEKDYLIQCKDKCKRKLHCGHDCPGMCYEDCNVKKCNVAVVKDLPCGHQKRVSCYQNPEKAFCFAPCQRKLDCGHQCTSVCGDICKRVQCEQLCQKECERGHSCQKRCHFGSLCGECMTKVNTIIPSCGHVIEKACYVDLSAIKCEMPCEKERDCGHPCNDICSRKCDATPCNVFVEKHLPCNHVVSMKCCKNPEDVACKETIKVDLPCKHRLFVKCSVAKAGLQKLSCKVKVEKELRCKHKLVLPCFKNPEDCICRKKVNFDLPCGHVKSIPCFIVTAGLPGVNCTKMTQQTLPCGHEATLPCHTKPEEYCCDKKVEISLNCGHNKWVKCGSIQDELQSGYCEEKVTRKLSCGHEKLIQCSLHPDAVICDAPCERLLPCKHPCPKKCGDDCAPLECSVVVQKDLRCGYHKATVLCSEDVSGLICSNPCNRKLKCSHPCPGKCSEDCCQYFCQRIVVKRLNCPGNHSRKMRCFRDPSSEFCEEQCGKNLQCGHRCPGLCGQPCGRTKCQRLRQKMYPCGHQEQIQCFDFETATCKAPCKRRKTTCKHICKGVCGRPCSSYPCDVAVTRTLPCNHKVKTLCSFKTDNIPCPHPCDAKLACGHQCSGNCHDCNVRGSHEICQLQCGRILVCSHRCRAQCGMPCPPCRNKCARFCPHQKCSKLCSELCSPCNKPCKWSCPHYQCNNLCHEECDRPRCDAPCPKKLPCSHPCIGLCGENCPTQCAICHAAKLPSLIGDGRTMLKEDMRYVQLLNCGHILTVKEMDSWMHREIDSSVQLIRCPRCSTAVTFSYRYGNQVKRTLKNLENVKRDIYRLASETRKFVRNVFHNLPCRPP
ncbi:NFX1-type zinc finger-containing protein 1-like [Montipora capricornis]|uniref:NFX1-type zinc finger-containing protein 1-like n=1 Tax=Montipora capricornis TaxID=246305 RepID=UPI0035F13587